MLNQPKGPPFHRASVLQRWAGVGSGTENLRVARVYVYPRGRPTTLRVIAVSRGSDEA